MRVTWVTRSFLDYRIPVFEQLNHLVGQNLSLVYSAEWTPERVQAKAADILGPRATGLQGERRLGSDARSEFANSRICIPYQPGLLRKIRDTQPDVLIADGFFRWTPAAIAHRWQHGAPLVICYERTAHTERRSQWYRRLHRRLVVRFTDAMCCNGRLSSEYSQSLGMPSDRITLGHMSADTTGLADSIARLESRDKTALREELRVDGTCFLFVGRLIPLKGVRELLNGWKQFTQTGNQPATLLVIGDGPELPLLQRMVTDHALPNVRFLGEVNYDGIAKYYAVADILVMPTLEDNWSLVVPEAMACGLPILCSIYNGCWPELVHDSINGWTFDPLQITDVVRVLHLAASNSNQLAAMGQASQLMVADHDPRHAAQSILEACEIAIRHRSGRFSRPASLR